MTVKPPAVMNVALVSAALGLAALFVGAAQSGGGQATRLDTVAIDRALGRTGQLNGDVYRVTFPRSDLHVTRDVVAIKTGLALTGWAAFRAVGSDVSAAAYGDGTCAPGTNRRARLMLWIGAVVVTLFPAFPYYAEYLF